MNKGKFSARKETEYPGQLHFHYNREERYSTLSTDVVNRENQKRGFFRKRSRPLVILFLDVLFVLVLFFIVSPILSRMASTTDFKGYELQLRAFVYESSTFLSVQIEAGEDLSLNESNMVTINFSLEGEDTGEELIDLLPERRGERRIYRAQLPGGKGRENAFAEVTIGEESVRLKAQIIPEQE